MRVFLSTLLQQIAAIALAIDQPDVSLISTANAAEPIEPALRQQADPGIGWFRYAGGGPVRTIDFGEMRVTRSFREGRVIYENSPLTFLTLGSTQVLGDGGEWVPYYNFRSVVNGLAWLFSLSVGSVKMEDGVVTYMAPWHYALFAPDCRLRVSLVNKVKLLLGTRTDYMLYRTSNTERGIQFTPHIGLDIGEFTVSPVTGVGLSVSVGYSNFWSFDESSRSGGPVLLLAVWTTVANALDDGI